MTIENSVAVDVKVSRPSPQSPLALEDPVNGYSVVSVGPGGRTWRRRTVEGEYVHGRVLVNATLDTRTMPLVVQVEGANWAQVRSRAQTMIDAVSQFAYTITTVLDGVSDTYVCEPADVALAGGDEWDKFRLMARQQVYVLTIPYDPVKVTP